MHAATPRPTFEISSERQTVIDLYTWTTPNGRKASIMLEEIGLVCHFHVAHGAGLYALDGFWNTRGRR